MGRPNGIMTAVGRWFDIYELLRRSPDGVTILDISRELDITPRAARRYLQRSNPFRVPTERVTVYEGGAQRGYRYRLKQSATCPCCRR